MASEQFQANTTVELNDSTQNGGSADAAGLPPALSEEEKAEIQNEITKLDDEINTLKQALTRKQRQLDELRAKLGITRWTRLQNSEATIRSKQAIADAAVKTKQVVSELGAATVNKWSEIKDSRQVQTAQEKFWSYTGTLKAKLVGGETKPADDGTNGTPLEATVAKTQ